MKIVPLVLCTLVALPAIADAAPQHKRTHKTYPRAPIAMQQPQIACTEVGCLPVPRGCYPTGGKTLDGLPSGFDVMVCPGRGTMYGHL